MLLSQGSPRTELNEAQLRDFVERATANLPVSGKRVRLNASTNKSKRLYGTKRPPATKYFFSASLTENARVSTGN